MEMKIPSQVEFMMNKLQEHGYEACVVGGCVRDTIMGRKPHDWDVATSAQPEEIKAALAGCRTLDTGLKHGTVTALIDRFPVEITTYREDGVYSDNRHPDQVHFTKNLKDDLKRRDFTMNALAYNSKLGMVDCFGGQEDIRYGIVRCVGEPDARFQEDGLRILRALRFAAELGFAVDDATSQSILRNAPLLRAIAIERVQTEFSRLLCGSAAAEILRGYRAVFCEFIPEISAMFDFPQYNRYHTLDVWEHTLKAVESVEATPVLRLTMLLHDIGKPSCFTHDENGVGHFYGHDEKSVKMASAILQRLKYDNRTAEQVITLVKYHDYPVSCEKKHLLRILNRLGEENLRLLLKVKSADIQAQNPAYQSRLTELAKAEAVLNEMIAENACFSLKELEIDGNDLISLGVPQGEQLGKMLQLLLEEVMEEKLQNRHWILMNRARLMKNGQL